MNILKTLPRNLESSLRTKPQCVFKGLYRTHLRALGVPANPTQRYVRGETSPREYADVLGTDAMELLRSMAKGKG